MDEVTHVELVDREGRVLARGAADATAFPLTVRLVGPPGDATASTTGVETRPQLGLLGRLMTPHGALLASLCTVGIATMVFAATAYTKPNAAARFGNGLGFYMLVLFWAGLWALGGRMAHRRAHFARQLTWSCLAALAVMVLTYVVGWVQFLFPAPRALTVVYAIASIVLAIVILNGHLAIASHMAPRRRGRVATAVVAGGVALLLLIAHAGDDFNTNMNYVTEMKPLDARFVPAESVDDFGHDVASLRSEVDSLAKK